MNIAVFCSANELENKYTKPARTLAIAIATAGHTLVWGGSRFGLMGIIADEAQQHGGKLIGIAMELFKANIRPNTDEMIIAKNLAERKALLLSRADVLVILAGGLGTLDEATEMIEHKRHGQHDKPIIVLNTDHFYDGLRLQLERMAAEGFLPIREHTGLRAMALSELVQFATTPQEVLTLLPQDTTVTQITSVSDTATATAMGV